LLAVVLAGLALVLDVDELVALGAQVHFLFQRLAHELALALELDESGHRAVEDFRRVAPLVLLEQLADQVQVAELVIHEALPDGLDARVVLLLHAAVVGVDLHGLVHQPLLQEALLRVLQGAVLGDVLLLDRGDLRVQLARQRVGEGRADGHVVVVGLVFGGGDHGRVDLGDQRRRVALVVVAQVVFRGAVVLGGDAPGHDVRVALQDVVGVLAFGRCEPWPTHEKTCSTGCAMPMRWSSRPRRCSPRRWSAWRTTRTCEPASSSTCRKPSSSAPSWKAVCNAWAAARPPSRTCPPRSWPSARVWPAWR